MRVQMKLLEAQRVCLIIIDCKHIRTTATTIARMHACMYYFMQK